MYEVRYLRVHDGVFVSSVVVKILDYKLLTRARALGRRVKNSTLKSPTTQRAFITYAQGEARTNEMVRNLSDKLRTDGVDARIDQYEPHPAQGWPRWMEQQFVEADRIIVVPSSTYLDRYNQSSGMGSGARFEAAILRTLLLKNGVCYEKMAVAILNKADQIYIPDLLHGCTRYVVSDNRGYEGLYRWLTDQPKIVPAKLGTMKKLQPKKALSSFRALCRRLKPLLDDNYRIFRDFGPNSGADLRARSATIWTHGILSGSLRSFPIIGKFAIWSSGIVK